MSNVDRNTCKMGDTIITLLQKTSLKTLPKIRIIKDFKYGVLNSSVLRKGTKLSISHCKKGKNRYYIICRNDLSGREYILELDAETMELLQNNKE